MPQPINVLLHLTFPHDEAGWDEHVSKYVEKPVAASASVAADERSGRLFSTVRAYTRALARQGVHFVTRNPPNEQKPHLWDVQPIAGMLGHGHILGKRPTNYCKRFCGTTWL